MQPLAKEHAAARHASRTSLEQIVGILCRYRGGTSKRKARQFAYQPQARLSAIGRA
jgi:hypothetical protein